MITVTDVHKRYWTSHGQPHWVLRGITLTFPSDKSVGIIGANGAGKSTLLRLMAGIDRPTRGEIRCDSRVSWPIGLTRSLQRMLTGRQNTRFICRIHGFDDDELDERVNHVHAFTDLGEAFDEPVRTYSNGMRARLNFSLSLALEFDMYLVDELMAAGDAAFNAKSSKAMKDLASRASMVIASHSSATLRTLCDAGVWIHEGKAYWFDSINDALKEYQKSVPHG